MDRKQRVDERMRVYCAECDNERRREAGWFLRVGVALLTLYVLLTSRQALLMLLWATL